MGVGAGELSINGQSLGLEGGKLLRMSAGAGHTAMVMCRPGRGARRLLSPGPFPPFPESVHAGRV